MHLPQTTRKKAQGQIGCTTTKPTKSGLTSQQYNNPYHGSTPKVLCQLFSRCLWKITTPISSATADLVTNLQHLPLCSNRAPKKSKTSSWPISPNSSYKIPCIANFALLWGYHALSRAPQSSQCSRALLLGSIALSVQSNKISLS